MTIISRIIRLRVNNRHIIRNNKGWTFNLGGGRRRISYRRVTGIDNVNVIKGSLDAAMGEALEGFLKFCKTEQGLGVVSERFAEKKVTCSVTNLVKGLGFSSKARLCRLCPSLDSDISETKSSISIDDDSDQQLNLLLLLGWFFVSSI